MSAPPLRQRRARRIAMTDEEREVFLREHLVCRVGTVNANGTPHVTPLWFVWDGEAIWLYSVIKSQRWTNLMRNPAISVVVDDGIGYFELRGVELLGKVEPVGEQPRVGDPNPELERPEQLFAQRYTEGTWQGYDERHAWLRLRPAKIVSWDFRKLGGSGDIFTPR